MNRTLVALATVLAVAGCKKNEPVTAAPIAPPVGGFPAMPAQGGMPAQGAMPPPSMPPGGGMPGGMPSGMPPAGMGNAGQLDQQIALLKQVVTQNPKDVNAWTKLGDANFDSFKATGDRTRAQASIEAYQKSLELNPKNPDVLTDQGVMYRDLGQLDKALANFLKANEINPNHMQSLSNAAVVYMDQGKVDKAEATWVKVVATDKTGQYAAQAGASLAQIRQQRAGMPGGAPPAPPAR